jgi:hypothetical protein
MPYKNRQNSPTAIVGLGRNSRLSLRYYYFATYQTELVVDV